MQLKLQIIDRPSVPQLARDFYLAAAGLLGDLASRWAEKRDYEELEDYQAPIETWIAEKGWPITIVNMTSRPFGMLTNIDGFECNLSIYQSGKYTLTPIKRTRIRQ